MWYNMNCKRLHFLKGIFSRLSEEDGMGFRAVFSCFLFMYTVIQFIMAAEKGRMAFFGQAKKDTIRGEI